VAHEHIDTGTHRSAAPAGPIVDAELAGTVVRTRHADADGGEGTATWPVEWLRDNCRCDDCRIVQTDERRWQPWLETGPPQVASVDVVDDELQIAWTSGHRSTFTASELTALVAASRRGSYTPRLWAASDAIEHVDHGAIVADHVARRRMFEAFLRDGAVVVTGSPREPGSCLELLRVLGLTPRDTSLGRIFDVQLDPSGFNVAYTSEAIPPHNDNAQCTHPPSGQVLAMLANDASGGDSVVVDGWAVLDRLRRTDPAAIDVLARVPVGFRQYSADAEGFTRVPMVVRDASGRFTHLRFSNQLRQPLPFDHPDLDEWYRAYRLLGQAVTDQVSRVTFRLSAGDTLFVNGMRVLHGRTEFRPDGRRHLQDVYFDVDDVIGNLARMTGEASDAMMTP